MRHKKTGSKRIEKSGVVKRNPQMPRGTVKVQGIVEAVVRQRGWSDKLYEKNVFDVWESVVGKAIAAQSAPISLFDGVLRVEVAHQVYANELSVMKTEIISKLENKLNDFNSRMPRSIPNNDNKKVVDIQFRLNPHVSKVKIVENGGKSTPNQQETSYDILRVLKSVSPEMKDQIDAAVSVVSDSELRDALKTLFLTQCSDTETTE